MGSLHFNLCRHTYRLLAVLLKIGIRHVKAKGNSAQDYRPKT